MKYRLLFAGCVTIASVVVALGSAIAQSDTPVIPCTAPEANQFDFWIGTWDLTWNDTSTGTNVITRDLDGCVIHENFSDSTNKFFGQSYSVYNSAKGIWQQTWVDNQGGYLEFEGTFDNGQMTLSRSFVGPKGKSVMQRMVFSNIAEVSIDWSWESSLDEGITWKQNWLIHYKRASD